MHQHDESGVCFYQALYQHEELWVGFTTVLALDSVTQPGCAALSTHTADWVNPSL